MKNANNSFKILDAQHDVHDLMDEICTLADTEKKALGFIPRGAYPQFATQKRVVVALGEHSEIAGYSIFGGTSLQAKIIQTYVKPGYRRGGLAKALVGEVIARAEKIGCLSIKAEVASDLEYANRFYEHCGFAKFGEKEGGKTTKRTLITRVKELNTPSLLDVFKQGMGSTNVSAIPISVLAETPLYLIDLNVLFDAAGNRRNGEAANRVISAAFENEIRIAIAEEFIEELERNEPDEKLNQGLSLSRAFPRLPQPNKESFQKHHQVLGPRIFPHRFENGKLTLQDLSDLRHLTTAIEQGAHGFVTSDRKILAQSEWLKRYYGLDVISPAMLGGSPSEASTGRSISINTKTSRLQSRDFDEKDRSGLEKLATSEQFSIDGIKRALASGTSAANRKRNTVFDDGKLIGFCSWSKGSASSPVSQLFVIVDHQATDVELVVDHLLDSACRDVAADRITKLWIDTRSRDVLLRNRSILWGFRPEDNSSLRHGKLSKICLGTALTPHNWDEIRSSIGTTFGIDLPASMPNYGSIDQNMTLESGQSTAIEMPIEVMEDFLSPCLLALPERPAVIVPILPHFVEALFHGSLQPTLLEEKQALMRRLRCYLSTPRSFNQIPDKGMIAFYESRGQSKSPGRSSAVAVARIRRRFIADKIVALNMANDRGVLSKDDVNRIAVDNKVCVTEIDNILKFRRPIELERLKTMRCADDANLVTARSVDSSSFQKLLEAGNAHT